MERAKILIKDSTVANLADHIFRNGMGVPIVLDSAPASADMKANTMAIHGSDIYIKHANGVLLKLSGTVIP